MALDVRSERVAAPELPQDPGARSTGRLLLRPAAIYLASRMLVLLTVWWGVASRGAPSVLRALAEWDGSWYLSVAVQGYPDGPPLVQGEAHNSNIAFFPIFPVSARVLSGLTGMSALHAALLIALVAGVAMAVLMWMFVRRITDEKVADRSILLFSFFPGSVVLSMAYSETVMLTMTLLCLLALQDRRWLGAGVAGALATASRPNALAVVACCAWEAGGAILTRREWRAMVAPLLAPLGFIGFMLFLWSRTGDPTVWFRVQREAWGERFDFGRRTFEEVLITFNADWAVGNTMRFQVIGLAFTLIALGVLVYWRPPAIVTIYTLGVLVLCLGSWSLGARPRFILTAFPLIVAVAWAVRGRWFAAMFAASTIGTILLTMIYTVPRMAVP
jgi:hypothetical protein